MPRNSMRVVFNGNDLSTIAQCKPERSIMPPVETISQAIGGRHGETFKRARLQSYEIPVTMWVRADGRASVASTRRQLAAMLWTDEPAPLQLPDESDFYYLATVEGTTDLDRISDTVSVATVNFKVCDPIAYGEEKTTSLTNNYQKTVTVGGTWVSYPTFTSTAAGGAWRIRNNTTGEFVEINADTVGAEIAEGAAIVCDMDKERVTLNGNTVGVTPDSDFFTIEGSTKLRVEGGTDTTATWRQRWI